jgi:hypothetical protein
MISVFFMAFMGINFLFPSTPQTTVQDMNYTVVVLGGVLILSIIWYYVPVYGGVHWFTGPVANVGMGESDSGSAAASAEYVDGNGLEDKKNAKEASV